MPVQNVHGIFLRFGKGEYVQQLTKIITEDNILKALSEDYEFLDSGGSGPSTQIAHCALQKLGSGIAPDAISRDILDLATSKTIKFIYCVGLTGAHIKAPVDLGAGVRLSDYSDVPLFAANSLRLNYKAASGPTISEYLKCAILVTHERAISGSSIRSNARSLAESALVAIMLSCEAARPYKIVFSSYVEHPAFEPLGALGLSNGSKDIVPWKAHPNNQIDASKAIAIFEKIAKLSLTDQEVIHISSDYFKASFQQNFDRDSELVISLGTSLELLLLHEIESELSFRFALNAANLLGGNNEDRRINYGLFKNMYSIRSKAVHTGKVDALQMVTFEKVIGKYLHILRRIIDYGKVPDADDWIKDFVFPI